MLMSNVPGLSLKSIPTANTRNCTKICLIKLYLKHVLTITYMFSLSQKTCILCRLKYVFSILLTCVPWLVRGFVRLYEYGDGASVPVDKCLIPEVEGALRRYLDPI